MTMSASPRENSHFSLDEFEEIERLIKENTAPDSEDEERDTTSAADSMSLKEPETHVQGDTGYQTSQAFDYAEESADPDTTTRDDSRISDHESSVSSRSSLRRTTHLQFDSRSSEEEDDAPPTERSNTEQEVTLIPSLATPRDDADEYENFESDENKLVATFGTTENFEALLQKQLEENYSDNDVPQQLPTKQTTQLLRHSTPAPASTKISLPRQKKTLNRTTRSPAANRARRASQKSRTTTVRSHSPGLADSSDDLSVRSEASRHELRQRLRKATSEKNKEQSITQQLQHDYDDLLTRFAEAENVIDQLRIGAKIDLFASIPNGGTSGGEQPGNGRLAASDPIHGSPPTSSPGFQRNTQRHSTSSSPRISRTPRPSQDVDSLTENSLKFPAAASTQFLRIALEHQANELREHMESFRTLLDEADVADIEKRQVLDDISKSLQKLEGDYITAGKDHDAEKRALILSGNAGGATIEDFDPDRKIEGEIYKLRKMLDDLQENISLGSSLPQTPLSSRRFHNSNSGGESGDSVDNTKDLDAGFNEQLRRYNKMPLQSDKEDNTTASSGNLSSDDDDTTVEFPANAARRKSSVSHNSSGLPERFLRPPSSNSTSPAKSRQPSPNSRTGPTKGTRNPSSPHKSNSSFQTSDGSPDSRRPRSRLPRPVGGRSQSTGVIPSRKPNSQDMDRDSGFVGSESSRQSYPIKYEPMLQRLSPVHSSPHSQRPVPVERKPSKQEKKMIKTTPKAVKTTKSPKTSTGTLSRHSDREGMPYKQEPSQSRMHDMSFTPPKQVFKQKHLMSEDGSSTWSTPLKPRPAISQQTFAPGASGSPMFSTTPVKGHHFQQPTSASVTSEKLRPSSRRSGASSSRDSTLDLLRGEIAKLREEIMENRALAEAKQKNKFESPAPKTSTSESQAPESSNRGRRSARTKDRRRGSKQDSHASDDSSTKRQVKTSKRDAKTGDDTPITTEQLSPVPDASPPDATVTVPKGHWEYVPPYFSPSAAATVRPIPAVYSSPVHSSVMPVSMDATYYSPVRYSSPARIYIPASPSVPVVYNSIPVETRMYQRRGSGPFIQAATQTSDRGDENDRPLTRSQLNSPKRSSSVPPLRQSYLDPQLSISLQRAERAASSLRQKSRSMYKSLRDSCNRSELASSYA